MYGEEEHDMIINSTIDNEARCKGKQTASGRGRSYSLSERMRKGTERKKKKPMFKQINS